MYNTDMTVGQITEIIEGSDLWIFGIRALHPDEQVSVGDEMPESYVWDDGDRTDESIGGTCCFFVQATADGVRNALDRALAYQVTLPNRRYALLGGKYNGNNDLIEEPHAIAIRAARVLAVWSL